jgi:hypothetical protein
VRINGRGWRVRRDEFDAWLAAIIPATFPTHPVRQRTVVAIFAGRPFADLEAVEVNCSQQQIAGAERDGHLHAHRLQPSAPWYSEQQAHDVAALLRLFPPARGRGGDGVRRRRAADGWITVPEAAKRRGVSDNTMYARAGSGKLMVEVEAGQKFLRVAEVDQLIFRRHGPHGDTWTGTCAAGGCDVKLERPASERARVKSGLHFCPKHQYTDEAKSRTGAGKRGLDRAPTARANRSTAKLTLWREKGVYDRVGADGESVRDKITKLGVKQTASYRPDSDDVPPDSPSVYAERLTNAIETPRGPDWRASASANRGAAARRRSRSTDGRFAPEHPLADRADPVVDIAQLKRDLDASARQRAQAKSARSMQAVHHVVDAALRDLEAGRTIQGIAVECGVSRQYVQARRAKLGIAPRNGGRPRTAAPAS